MTAQLIFILIKNDTVSTRFFDDFPKNRLDVTYNIRVLVLFLLYINSFRHLEKIYKYL